MKRLGKKSKLTNVNALQLFCACTPYLQGDQQGRYVRPVWHPNDWSFDKLEQLKKIKTNSNNSLKKEFHHLEIESFPVLANYQQIDSKTWALVRLTHLIQWHTLSNNYSLKIIAGVNDELWICDNFNDMESISKNFFNVEINSNAHFPNIIRWYMISENELAKMYESDKTDSNFNWSVFFFKDILEFFYYSSAKNLSNSIENIEAENITYPNFQLLYDHYKDFLPQQIINLFYGNARLPEQIACQLLDLEETQLTYFWTIREKFQDKYCLSLMQAIKSQSIEMAEKLEKKVLAEQLQDLLTSETKPYIKSIKDFYEKQPTLVFKNLNHFDISNSVLFTIKQPRTINQYQTKLCAPAAFLGLIAHLKPELFVEIALTLATKGQMQFPLKLIVNSKSLNTQADFILVMIETLRHSYNFTGYDSNGFFSSYRAGSRITDLYRWLEACGFYIKSSAFLTTSENEILKTSWRNWLSVEHPHRKEFTNKKDNLTWTIDELKNSNKPAILNLTLKLTKTIIKLDAKNKGIKPPEGILISEMVDISRNRKSTFEPSHSVVVTKLLYGDHKAYIQTNDNYVPEIRDDNCQQVTISMETYGGTYTATLDLNTFLEGYRGVIIGIPEEQMALENHPVWTATVK